MYTGVHVVYSPLFISRLSIYSKHIRERGPVASGGVKFMAESKIILALEKFSRDYAWDKSLTTHAANSTPPRPPLINCEHSNTSIEDFINGSRESK